MTRADGRAFDQLRPVEMTPGFTKFAEGSVLIRCGETVVLCNASVEEKTPPHVAEGCGWVTAGLGTTLCSSCRPCERPSPS